MEVLNFNGERKSNCNLYNPAPTSFMDPKKTSWGLQNLYYFQATRNSLVESWIMENIFCSDQYTLGCFPAVRQSLRLTSPPKFSLAKSPNLLITEYDCVKKKLQNIAIFVTLLKLK